ncbi:hypothetical protein ACQKWADRAFT_74789 [Trichoderma austrokoningii]
MRWSAAPCFFTEQGREKMKPAAWTRRWGLWFFWARSNLRFYVYGRVCITFLHGGGKTKKRLGSRASSPSLARFAALPRLALPCLSRPLPTHPSVSGTCALTTREIQKACPSSLSLCFASASASASTHSVPLAFPLLLRHLRG